MICSRCGNIPAIRLFETLRSPTSESLRSDPIRFDAMGCAVFSRVWLPPRPPPPVALARLRGLYCAGSMLLALCAEHIAVRSIVLTVLRWLCRDDSIPCGSFGLHERRHLSLELQPLLQTLEGIPTGQGEGGEAAAMMFTRRMEEVMIFFRLRCCCLCVCFCSCSRSCSRSCSCS